MTEVTDLKRRSRRLRPGVIRDRLPCQSAKAISPEDRLSDEIAQLRDLDLEGLRLRWRNMFGRAAPQHAPKFLLARILAYRLQAEAHGDLGKAARRMLERLADRALAEGCGECGGARDAGLMRVNASSLPIGTVLTREWDGVVHRVVVTENGFAWNGEVYPSLTKIAHLITSGKWNGPRFFGLRTKSESRGPKRDVSAPAPMPPPHAVTGAPPPRSDENLAGMRGRP